MIQRGHDPLYWAKECKLHEVVKELSKVCIQQCELYLHVAGTIEFCTNDLIIINIYYEHEKKNHCIFSLEKCNGTLMLHLFLFLLSVLWKLE